LIGPRHTARRRNKARFAGICPFGKGTCLHVARQESDGCAAQEPGDRGHDAASDIFARGCAIARRDADEGQASGQHQSHHQSSWHEAAQRMSTQLPLPASWAQFESRRDPRQRLEALQRDVATARARIREALAELAERHGIAKRDVTYAMEGYADNLLGDVVYNVERALEHEIEGETEP
jgi:hypothetical protein